MMTSNPIEMAELRHQEYVIESSRSGRVWIIIASIMLIPALLTSLASFVMIVLDIPLPQGVDINEVQNIGQALWLFGFAMMLTLNLAQYLVVLMISFGLATNSITREKRNKTWDTLLLTNVSARQLVMGKFWASLKALRGDHTIVALLRLGMLAYVMGEWVFAPLPPDTAPLTIHILVVTALMLAFTALDAAFNTALGLLAVLFEAPRAVGVALFGALRVFAMGYGIWWIVVTVDTLFQWGGWRYLLSGLFGLAIFALLTVMVLWLAQIVAIVSANATPPADSLPSAA